LISADAARPLARFEDEVAGQLRCGSAQERQEQGKTKRVSKGLSGELKFWIFEEAVEEDDEFAHQGDERDLLGLTVQENPIGSGLGVLTSRDCLRWSGGRGLAATWRLTSWRLPIGMVSARRRLVTGRRRFSSAAIASFQSVDFPSIRFASVLPNTLSSAVRNPGKPLPAQIQFLRNNIGALVRRFLFHGKTETPAVKTVLSRFTT